MCGLFLKAKGSQAFTLGIEPRTLVLKLLAKIGVALIGGREVLLRFIAGAGLPVILIGAQVGLLSRLCEMK